MTKEELNSLSSASQFKMPQEWQMDPSPHYFALQFGPKTDTGKAINKLMKDYEEKCAKAKILFYVDLYNLLKGKVKF